MKRFLFSIFVWLFSISVPGTLLAGDIVYVDQRVRTEPQEYAVVFSAYDGEFGHAFVTLVWGDAVQNATLQRGVGFYPGDSDKSLKLAFGGQGSLQDDTWQSAEVILSVLLNKEKYDAAISVLDQWEKPTPYFLGLSDCTTFVADVAEAIGINRPSRVFAPYPIDYLRELVSLNAQ